MANQGFYGRLVVEQSRHAVSGSGNVNDAPNIVPGRLGMNSGHVVGIPQTRLRHDIQKQECQIVYRIVSIFVHAADGSGLGHQVAAVILARSL